MRWLALGWEEPPMNSPDGNGGEPCGMQEEPNQSGKIKGIDRVSLVHVCIEANGGEILPLANRLVANWDFFFVGDVKLIFFSRNVQLRLTMTLLNFFGGGNGDWPTASPLRLCRCTWRRSEGLRTSDLAAIRYPTGYTFVLFSSYFLCTWEIAFPCFLLLALQIGLGRSAKYVYFLKLVVTKKVCNITTT